MSETRSDDRRREPGPDHPITITRGTERVIVQRGETIIADSSRPLILQEASYPAVYYLPIADVAMGELTPSDSSTYCPFKGTARYYDFSGGGTDAADAVWSYPEPYPAVALIRDHLAFYPDRVMITTR